MYCLHARAPILQERFDPYFSQHAHAHAVLLPLPHTTKEPIFATSFTILKRYERKIIMA